MRRFKWGNDSTMNATSAFHPPLLGRLYYTAHRRKLLQKHAPRVLFHHFKWDSHGCRLPCPLLSAHFRSASPNVRHRKSRKSLCGGHKERRGRLCSGWSIHFNILVKFLFHPQETHRSTSSQQSTKYLCWIPVRLCIWFSRYLLWRVKSHIPKKRKTRNKAPFMGDNKDHQTSWTTPSRMRSNIEHPQSLYTAVPHSRRRFFFIERK